MELIAHKKSENGQWWCYRAYLKLSSSEMEEHKKIVDGKEDYHLADDFLRRIHVAANVFSRGSNIPGRRFANEPRFIIVNDRVMVTQTGGLDI